MATGTIKAVTAVTMNDFFMLSTLRLQADFKSKRTFE